MNDTFVNHGKAVYQPAPKDRQQGGGLSPRLSIDSSTSLLNLDLDATGEAGYQIVEERR